MLIGELVGGLVRGMNFIHTHDEDSTRVLQCQRSLRLCCPAVTCEYI